MLDKHYFGYSEDRLKQTEDLLYQVQCGFFIDEAGAYKKKFLQDIEEYQSCLEKIWKQNSR